jgi:putative ABC transport system substrate-binding protein
MNRRDIIALLGGAAVWPVAARAQQTERMRRIGVLENLAANDPQSPVRVAAFAQGLQELGWTVDRSVRIDYRWGGAADDARVRTFAGELVALAPDVILAAGGTAVRALQQATSTVPIVFTQVTDPVGGGLVASLARPGGNTTGFAASDYVMRTKSLELLKQVAPHLTRVAAIRDSSAVGGSGQLGAILAVAPSLGVDVRPLDAHDASGIERAIGEFVPGANGGLIVVAGRLALVHRDLIIKLAAQHRLPTIYPNRVSATEGGLISYGPDEADFYRSAAGYVDRILKGAQAADLPVQSPTKFQTVINLKTAKTLGLTVPPSLLAIADEVIE